MYIYFFRYVSTSSDYSQSQCTRLDITGETSWKIWTYSDISRRKLYNIHKARHPIIQHLLFSTFTKYRTLSKRPTLLFPDFFMSMEACIVVSAPSLPFSPYTEGASKCAFLFAMRPLFAWTVWHPLWENWGFKFKSPLSLFPNAKSLGVLKSWEAIGSESANS